MVLGKKTITHRCFIPSGSKLQLTKPVELFKLINLLISFSQAYACFYWLASILALPPFAPFALRVLLAVHFDLLGVLLLLLAALLVHVLVGRVGIVGATSQIISVSERAWACQFFREQAGGLSSDRLRCCGLLGLVSFRAWCSTSLTLLMSYFRDWLLCVVPAR